MKQEVIELIELIESMDEDEDNEKLEKAMHFYCSLWDIREGYKHALKLALIDQYTHHASEAEDGDIELIKKHLI